MSIDELLTEYRSQIKIQEELLAAVKVQISKARKDGADLALMQSFSRDKAVILARLQAYIQFVEDLRRV